MALHLNTAPQNNPLQSPPPIQSSLFLALSPFLSISLSCCQSPAFTISLSLFFYNISHSLFVCLSFHQDPSFPLSFSFSLSSNTLCHIFLLLYILFFLFLSLSLKLSSICLTSAMFKLLSNLLFLYFYLYLLYLLVSISISIFYIF